mmetsp:Transcript_15581/g.23896  ORF Transcript_15581/g.23896 Transcript_15581/m.23896 type:complete len:115 (-) Transcript_15581:2147-2491(-)
MGADEAESGRLFGNSFVIRQFMHNFIRVQKNYEKAASSQKLRLEILLGQISQVAELKPIKDLLLEVLSLHMAACENFLSKFNSSNRLVGKKRPSRASLNDLTSPRGKATTRKGS